MKFIIFGVTMQKYIDNIVTKKPSHSYDTNYHKNENKKGITKTPK